VGAALLRVNRTPGSSITEAEVKQFATLSLGRSLALSHLSCACAAKSLAQIHVTGAAYPAALPFSTAAYLCDLC